MNKNVIDKIIKFLNQKNDTQKISFQSAMKIFDELEIQFDLEDIELNDIFELLKNKNFYHIVETIYNNYRPSILSGTFFENVENQFLSFSIEAYCILNNIEINEDENEDENENDYSNNSLDITNMYIQEIINKPLLTSDETERLIKKAQDGDIEARNTLVESNMKLVLKIARKYSGLPLVDLINEGTFGLIRSIEKFDLTKDLKLSTYATWWIRQAIRRALDYQRRTIRTNPSTELLINACHKFINEFQMKYSREPTDEELSEHLGISIKRLQAIRNAQYEPISLDAQVNDDSETTFSNFIPSTILNPEEQFIKDNNKELIEELFEAANLTAREKQIIKLRFGLIDGIAHDLRYIGEIFNVSYERIRQIEAKGLRKLYKLRYNQKYKPLFNESNNQSDITPNETTPPVQTCTFYQTFCCYSEEEIGIVIKYFLDEYEKNLVEKIIKNPEIQNNEEYKAYQKKLYRKIKSKLLDVRQMLKFGIKFDDNTNYSELEKQLTIYEIFKLNSTKEVDDAIKELSLEDQTILYEVFGNNLHNPYRKNNMTNENVIILKIGNILKSYNYCLEAFRKTKTLSDILNLEINEEKKDILKKAINKLDELNYMILKDMFDDDFKYFVIDNIDVKKANYFISIIIPTLKEAIASIEKERIDNSIKKEESISWLDNTIDECKIIKEFLLTIIINNLSELDLKEQLIISLKFGLTNKKCYSTEQIAQYLDIQEKEVLSVIKKYLELSMSILNSRLNKTIDNKKYLKIN